jgi:hypothetical protein
LSKNKTFSHNSILESRFCVYISAVATASTGNSNKYPLGEPNHLDRFWCRSRGVMFAGTTGGCPPVIHLGIVRERCKAAFFDAIFRRLFASQHGRLAFETPL